MVESFSFALYVYASLWCVACGVIVCVVCVRVVPTWSSDLACDYIECCCLSSLLVVGSIDSSCAVALWFATNSRARSWLLLAVKKLQAQEQ